MANNKRPARLAQACLLGWIAFALTVHDVIAQDRPPAGSTRAIQAPRIAVMTLPAGVTHDPLAGLAYKVVGTAPVIDGRLDDPVWAQAAIAKDFWIADQQRAPSERTEVLVLADERNLYFGFRVYDSRPDAIDAIQTRRDAGLGYDDQVSVEIDSYFNRRDISRFSVSARGVQDDAIAGGRSAKIEWKGDWSAATARTEYGWSAEIAIPFAVLNYQEGDTTFGVNFVRYHNRTQERSVWADVTPQILPEEMGQLTGLALPPAAAKQPWTVMPYALVGWNIPNKEGEIKDHLVSAGADLRYQPRPDLTGLLSLNPDFSQVERQITDINFSYVEKVRADVRPFFEEGATYLGPTSFFYSNRVPSFDVGGKAFGRFGRTQFGAFVVSAPQDRADYAARALYEIDSTHSVTGQVVGTNQENLDNVLAVAQFSGRRASGFNYAADAAWNDTSGPLGQGSYLRAALGWRSDYWSVGGEANRYSTEYVPLLALVGSNLPGTEGGKLFANYFRESLEGPFRQLRGDLVFSYRETTEGLMQLRNWYAFGSAELQNQVRLGLTYSTGPYRPNVTVAVPPGSSNTVNVPGEFISTFNDDRYATVSLDLNTRSSRAAAGLSHSWGDLGGGSYAYSYVYAWWRPINTLYLNVTAERLDNFGTSNQYVFVGQWDVTPADSLSTRYVYRDDFDSYRVAYGRRVRRGIDIFAVYDKESPLDPSFSVKLLVTYP